MKPIQKIPVELLDQFTLNGHIPVEYDYEDATNPEIQEEINKNFNLNIVNDSIKRILKHEYSYYQYTDVWMYQALDAFSIFNKDVALIGSTHPWYEAMLLTRVPKSVTVIEYSDRNLDGIPNLRYTKPDNVNQKFDAIVSISSYEHDGLGRYGDPINPDGDLLAMQNLSNILKPDGLLFLAIPIGPDKLVFNKHRIYGRIRLPLLLKGWTILGAFGYTDQRRDTAIDASYQPVFVLRKNE